MPIHTISDRDFLNAVLENAGALVVILDHEGRICRFNRACEMLSGYTFAEVEGKFPWDTFLPPEDADNIRHNAFEMFARNPQASAEHYTNYWQTKSGERRLTEWSNTALLDSAGNMDFMVCLGNDITERHRINEALRTSEQRLREAEQIAHVGAWHVDLLNNEVWWSDEQYRINGIPRGSEPLRQEFFRQLIYPEDRELMEKAFDILYASGSFEGEFRIQRPDGEVRHLLGCAKAIYDANGKIIRIAGTNQDITERINFERALKESEANFRTLTESANVGILVGNGTRTLYANRFLLDLLGYRLDEFTRIGIKETIHPDEYEKVLQRFQARMNGEPAPAMYETVFLSRNGQAVPVEITPTLTNWQGKQASLLFVQDITKRLQAEQRYQSVIATLSEGVLVQQTDGQIMACNAAAEEILGLSADQICGRAALDPGWHTIREDGSPLALKEHPGMIAANTGKSSSNVTLGVDHPARGLRWISINARPLLLPGAKTPYGSVASFTDITERRKFEEEIQRLAAIVRNSQDFIGISDIEGHALYLNEAGRNLVGIRDDAHFYSTKIPDYFINRERERVVNEIIPALMSKGRWVGDTFFQHFQTGREIPVSFDIFRIDDPATGKPINFATVTKDITDRVEALAVAQRNERELKAVNETLEARVLERTAEVRFQALRNETILNTTTDAFCVTDTSGVIRDANPAYCTMHGYSKAEIIGMSVADIEASENPVEIATHLEKVIAEGHDRFDTFHRRKDGSIIEIEISLSYVDFGNERLFYAFARDITARKETEAALIQARDESERANKSKSDFLARMSHELRTPMNAILGFAQLLELEIGDTDTLMFAREIYRAGEHLLELINELLDLSSIEAGKLPIVVQPVSLHRVVTEAEQILQPLLNSKDVSLMNHCDINATVLADDVRLKQILVNLLSNAAKYNRSGGRIVVSCHTIAKDRVHISVTDTGQGIPADKISLLFTPFERIGAEYGEIDGTGIGLALSRQLAELMDGTLGVESTFGQGSTFWLELPLAKEEQVLSPVDATQSTFAGDHHTVLYIEDNAANLRVVEAIFRRNPRLRLFSATNGTYGLELVRRYQPDIILLDIHLPDIDGYTVLAALKADPATRQIPLIALSADAMPFDIEKGLAAGFSRYITKPININELLAAIDQCLQESLAN